MPTPPPQGAVDIAVTYGGDVQLDATGAPVLFIDTPTDAPATLQQIYRLLMTAPRLFASDGVTPIAPADDMFHPTLGAGLPARVDSLQTVDLMDEIESAILQGLSLASGVSQAPGSSSVSVTSRDAATVEVDVTFQTTSGATVVLPTIPLTATGG